MVESVGVKDSRKTPKGYQPEQTRQEQIREAQEQTKQQGQ